LSAALKPANMLPYFLNDGYRYVEDQNAKEK
jgi:hypothetical protein